MTRRHLRYIVKKRCLKICDVLLSEINEIIEDEENRRKRKWVHNWIGRRDALGASALLLKELAAEDIKEYTRCLRMTPEIFKNLLAMITPKMQKQDTHKGGSQYVVANI